MNGDPLYRPLEARPLRMRGSPVVKVAVGGLLVFALGTGLAIWHIRAASTGSSSVAVAPIEPLPPHPPPQVAAVTPATAPNAPAAPSASGAQVLANGDTVEVQNGVKIIRMAPPGANGGAHPGAGVTAVPGMVVPLSPAPDPRLIEHTPTGDLPKIGDGDLRPASIYARPLEAMAMGKAGLPRIALLVGDLGGETAMAATSALPANVSLAFRSDAGDVTGQVSRARDAGHEIFLELSGKLDAPSRDPHQLVDALHAEMVHFSGYVGVTTPLGTGLRHDTDAIVQDLGARGLLFLDSATALEDPGSAKLPYARPDVAIDGRLAKTSIDAAFAQLESVARTKGRAIGYIGHLSSIDAVAAFTGSLEAKGLILVPVSAVVSTMTNTAAAQNNR